MKWAFRLDYHLATDETKLRIIQRADSWDRVQSRICSGLTFKSTTESTIDDAALQDDGREFLQAALDYAWSEGLRPAGFKDFTNEIAAVRYHLEDMRKLAKLAK